MRLTERVVDEIQQAALEERRAAWVIMARQPLNCGLFQTVMHKTEIYL
jgi:hypothetical protein